MIANRADGSRWFVSQVKPGGTRRAEVNLRRQGIEAFHPRQRVTRRQRGTLVTRAEPVFPGYLFLCFDPATAPWAKINNTYGVSRLLMTPDRRPAPLPDGFVPLMRARSDADGLLQMADDLAPGDRIRLLTGPFADTVARIETLDRDGRIALLLDLMGRSVRVTVTTPEVRRED